MKKAIWAMAATAAVLGMTLSGLSPVFGEEADATEQGPEQEIQTMQIGSAQDLLHFAEEVNNGNIPLNAELTSDIDLSEVCSETAGNWTPIQDYEGVFEGNGHTIKGLYCVNPENKRAALFGSTTSHSSIQNLTLEDVYVEGESYAAGLVGNGMGDVSGVTVSGYVKGNDSVAGICAVSASVADCVNYATVVCDNGEDSFTNGRCGGVAGMISYTADNCVNYGTITGAEWVTGGVIGGTPKSGGADIRYITNCFNYGNVEGCLYTGGVVGYIYDTVIDHCGNEADVTGMAYVAGVLSSSYDKRNGSLVINCYNKGNITGKDWGEGNDALLTGGYDYIDEQRIGGIASELVACYVCNCYSWGSAQCLAPLYRSTTAGIAGSHDYTECIANCYSNMDMSNAYEYEPLGIGLTDEYCDHCFYVNGIQDESNWIASATPGQPESEFTDGTILAELNNWPTEETDSSYTDFLDQYEVEPDEWVQGEHGPVFIWEEN